MAVIKLSTSGRQVQFIDDEGNVFVTSSAYVMGLFQGKSNHQLILLSRLPLKASKDRFKQSPLYDPSGLMKENNSHETNIDKAKDAFAPSTIKELKEVNQFKDKQVW